MFQIIKFIIYFIINFHYLQFEVYGLAIKNETYQNLSPGVLKEVNGARQFQPGGGGGGGFQPGGSGGGGGFQPGGFQQPGGTTEDDGEEEVTSPGPGALNILSGIFNILNGIGSLNYPKVLESTVKFYPPHLQQKAQADVDRLLGRTTKKPKTPPVNTTIIVYIDRNNETTVKGVKATTIASSSTTEDEEEEDYSLLEE